MELKRAIEIVQYLADGVNPQTGEVMEHDSVFQNPETVRALFTALEQLKKTESRIKRSGSLPGHSGNAWTAEEEASLIAEFDSGMDMASIAKRHGRTNWAIQARLLKLNKIQA
ncbi:MAG: hypothetical protein CVU49_05110 [Candidatus Cloacimonetes bacterium HGW-Cloacimonetes-2]|jgi:hypothetical protein|nr:MAG: hypothetical protein CVU49_05110 [Candidatus Cloacimonetes bacterium HGW-Cloacimonetes-2]